MDKFLDSYGLVLPHPGTEVRENSILFTVEHYMLTGERKELVQDLIELCRTDKGLYSQHPSHALQGKDRYMSHDQLTAMIAFSKMNDLDIHKEFWEEIKRQWYRYNNIDVPQTFMEKLLNKRFLHPRDIIFYSYCNKGLGGYLFFPILIIIMIISLWQKKEVIAHGEVCLDTDGKLLSYVRMKAIDNRVVTFLFNWIIKKRFGSWHNIFKEYFRYEDHPNVIASKDI